MKTVKRSLHDAENLKNKREKACLRVKFNKIVNFFGFFIQETKKIINLAPKLAPEASGDMCIAWKEVPKTLKILTK